MKTQHLIAAAAVLSGRAEPTGADLWPLIMAVPTRDEQNIARDCLRDFLSASENSTLSHIVEEVSLGPLARAARIVTAGKALLSAGPDGPVDQWRLKLEGLAREIDAGFMPDQMPVELSELRGVLVAEITRTAPAQDEVPASSGVSS